MLPPIDPSVLESNPQFATLYKRLTHTILNPDGSIRVSVEEAQSQAKVEEDLINAQITAAKISILRFSLRYLLTPDLPNELQDLITLILTSPDPSSSPLLAQVLSDPPSSPSLLAPLLAPHLCSLLTQLSRIADPESATPLTAAQISARRAALVTAQRQLDESRISLAVAAGAVLETRRAVDDAAVRVLEGVKFGTVARGVSAEAGYLALVAEAMAEKSRASILETLQSVYDPEVRQAIESYTAHLTSVKARWNARAGTAGRALAEYEDAGGAEMREIADRYRELTDEVEGVKAQVRRLGGDA